MFSKIHLIAFFAFTIVFGTAFTQNNADAATYRSLTKQGFETGTLSHNKAGTRGWRLRKGADRYFCKMQVGLVYVGKNDIATFGISGKLFILDRKIFDAKNRGRIKNIPHLRNIKSGRISYRNVGSCRKLRK